MKKEVLPANSNGNTAVAKPGFSNLMPDVVDLTSSNIPDLEDCEVSAFDMITNYWTPEKKDEYKNLFFVGITEEDYEDKNTNEVKRLKTANFLEQKKDENGKVSGLAGISNASARLVGKLESYMTAGKIQSGSAMRVIYNGKEKNSTNSFYSDTWSVHPIAVKQKQEHAEDAEVVQ